jgi:hypothetical protein
MPIKDENQNPLELLAGMSSGGGRKHAVPQNVMDVEFKVVGDITLRQLGYLLAGGALFYTFFNLGLPNFWAWTLAIASAGMALLIAFVPIEERPLEKWLLLFLKAMRYDTQLIWRKSSVTPAYFLSDYADIIKNEIITLTPVKSRNKLDEYLGLIPEDQDEMDLYQTVKVSAIATKFESQMNEPAKLATDIKLLQVQEPTLSFTEPLNAQYKFPNAASIPLTTIPLASKPTKEEILKDEYDTKVLVSKAYISKSLEIPPEDIKPSEVSESSSRLPIHTSRALAAPKSSNAKPAATTKVIRPMDHVAPIIAPKSASAPTQNSMQAPAQQRPISKPTPAPTPAPQAQSEPEQPKKPTPVFETNWNQNANREVDRPIKTWPKKYESQLKSDIKIRTTAKLPTIIVTQDIKEIEQQESSLEKKIEELMNIAGKAKKELESQGLNVTSTEKIEYFQTKYHELKQEKENLKTELEKNTSRVDQIEEEHKKKDLEEQVQSLTKQNEDLEHKLEFIQDQLFILNNQKQTQAPASAPSMQNSSPKPNLASSSQDISQVTPELLRDSQIKHVQNTVAQQMPDKLPSEILKEQQRLNAENQNAQAQKSTQAMPIEPQPLSESQEFSDLADRMAKSVGRPSDFATSSVSANNKDRVITKGALTHDNIIYGTVKNQFGVLADNTVVLIKDVKGNVLRALKTNKLGQFKTQTPVDNGTYLIEAIKGGENFDIIRVEAVGTKLNPVYLIGKLKQ